MNNNNAIFLDTETCGLHGPIVLFQYAIGINGKVNIVDVWEKTVNEIIELYEMVCKHPDGIIAFNFAFDWFHIYQQWTVLQLLKEKGLGERVLNTIIWEYALTEEQGRFYPYCLKPISVFDIMLHARKTKYQSTMDRKDIKIRKVPNILAQPLCDELNARIKLNDIYFARRKKDRDIHWKVYQYGPEFKNIVLKFAASSGLKALAIDALGLSPDEVLLYSNSDEGTTGVGVPKYLFPAELGYAPFYSALVRTKLEKDSWPYKIKYHIDWWKNKGVARVYAEKDVSYLQQLYRYFQDINDDNHPMMNDDDSILASLVALVRWKGFSIDIPKIRLLKEKYKKIIGEDDIFNPDHVPTAFKQAQIYIAEGFFNSLANQEIANGEMRLFLSRNTTKKIFLKELVKEYNKDSDFPDVGIRAAKVLEARDAKYLINFLNKLLLAGRLHPAMEVIGTLSSRMSGRGAKFNVQGIKRTKEIRECFPLADSNNDNIDWILAGGDFESFEVAIAAAKYKDSKLIEDLLKCWKCGYKYKSNELLMKTCPQCKTKDSRQKVHGLFGMELYPGNSYIDILSSKGTNNDMYSTSKNGVFSMIYGGDKNTLIVKYGIPQEVAERAEIGFIRKYPNVGREREKTKSKFQSMIQPRGIGTQVIWREPSEYVESMLGFRRYFILENMICKALFQLANDVNKLDKYKPWREIKVPIMRRDRVQSASGSIQSALYAAAFNLQSSNMRAAENHTIQSTGSQINKKLQVNLWDLQPKGINEWQIIPLNIHDEIMMPIRESLGVSVKKIVNETVESFRNLIPLIAFDLKIGIKNWAEK
jgi:hypothetical protein